MLGRLAKSPEVNWARAGGRPNLWFDLYASGRPRSHFRRMQRVPKTFACKANLQQHQQSTKHRGVSDLIPVAWKVCRKAFTHKGDLQSHQEALEHKPLSNLTGLVGGTGERPLPIARSSSWSALTGDTSMPDAPRLPRSRSVLVTSDATGPLENGILTPCTTRSPSPGSSALSVD